MHLPNKGYLLLVTLVLLLGTWLAAQNTPPPQSPGADSAQPQSGAARQAALPASKATHSACRIEFFIFGHSSALCLLHGFDQCGEFDLFVVRFQPPMDYHAACLSQ